MENEELDRICTCGALQDNVADPDVPVVFDAAMQEYHLELRSGLGFKLMYYCLFCGGRLPSSIRASLFSEPSDEEVAEAQSLLGKGKTIDEVFDVLGPPDATSEWSDAPYGSPRLLRWKRAHTYSKRWQSLSLVVFELEDGSVSHTWMGKFIGPSEKSHLL